jgi:RNA polymerase sigma-70 factor (ECF subfamily)
VTSGSATPHSLSFQELYEAHVGFVYRVLRRFGVPAADLADALQEVFVVVYRRWPEFEGRSQVTTWLYRIALRTARDRRRRAHVRREVLQPGALQVAASASAPADECLQQQRDLALLDEALESLSSKQRDVFTLFELEELSGEQIAEVLQIPLGTVYSRLRLARAAFNKAVRRRAALPQPTLRAISEVPS